MKESFLENDTLKCWHEDGILHAAFQVPVLDLAGTKIAVDLRVKVSNATSFPMLVDARKVKSITKESRDYLASDEGTKYLLATGLLLDSTIGRFLGNFFLQINKPKVPLKLFTDETEALNWLGQFKKKN